MNEFFTKNDSVEPRPRLLSVKEVARELSTHPATVYRLIAEGKIPAKRIRDADGY